MSAVGIHGVNLLRVGRLSLVGVLLLVTAVASDGVALATPGGISTIAGIGVTGSSGDGGAATSAELWNPNGVAVDADGNVFIADFSNHKVRRIDGVTGVITTLAGTGTVGFSGDGGPADAATLHHPRAVAVDSDGNVFISDTTNNRVRRVDAVTGLISTVAGTGAPTFTGDGMLATGASLQSPRGVAVDDAGNLFITDYSHNRIRRVDAVTGLISTVAGIGDPADYSGDGGLATNASLAWPVGVAVDGDGNLFIADTHNLRVRRVEAGTGIISTFAGTGTFGSSGDGTAATSADLKPLGVAVDSDGNVFIADAVANRVRRVDIATGIINTIAGDGTSGYSGDGAAATSAQLAGPLAVAVDGDGNVFIADGNNQRIRRVDALDADDDGFPDLVDNFPLVASVCRGRQATQIGTSGANVLTGTNGIDVMMGLGGDDTINGLGGDDLICAGGGSDVVHGGDGKDTIYGEDGADTMYGDEQSDKLYGGNGIDTLKGNGGTRDRLFGGDGVDNLNGGTGNDDRCTTGETYAACEVVL